MKKTEIIQIFKNNLKNFNYIDDDQENIFIEKINNIANKLS